MHDLMLIILLKFHYTVFGNHGMHLINGMKSLGQIYVDIQLSEQGPDHVMDSVCYVMDLMYISRLQFVGKKIIA